MGFRCPYLSTPLSPGDRVFLFDNSNGRVSISSGQVYEMMARYVYLMANGELAQEYNSLDNNLNPKVRGTHRQINKPTCYSSFGYYSVIFPRRAALQLAAADLALDVVEQGSDGAACSPETSLPRSYGLGWRSEGIGQLQSHAGVESHLTRSIAIDQTSLVITSFLQVLKNSSAELGRSSAWPEIPNTDHWSTQSRP